MKQTNHPSNNLINEKSPYLLQHAYNPVNWYPWTDEAFELARQQDKPVFLSIGYSTCHWCHVMEKESFEDDEVASLMNDSFINIKVDREERPDIDNIYMTVCQLSTGSGGWPLSIILTPNKEPFYIDTYIPKDTRFMKIGMKQLIPQINKLWKENRSKIYDTSNNMSQILIDYSSKDNKSKLVPEVLKYAFESLYGQFDHEYGGFGRGMKFPSPHNLLFLLRYWKRYNNNNALLMVESTLSSMKNGGIYDHIGYGFHRYSTDRQWLLPHFEKMLYDQAMISIAYLEAYQATGVKCYLETAEETIKYVLRDLTDNEGGFYAGEDADSEGIEGKFYTWKYDEIVNILGEQDAKIFSQIYNIDEEGNFKDESTRVPTGENIPHLIPNLSKASSNLNKNKNDMKKHVDSIKEKLFEKRKQRIHPHKDDKVLTDWNGLMIAALAKAAQITGNELYIIAAQNAVNFIKTKLVTKEGRLLHRYREGEASINAYLDDYAFFIWGLIELYEVTYDISLIKTALDLNDKLINHFWDHENAGFYFTADYAEKVLVRKKEYFDNAIPSGNSVAMLNMIKLARLTSRIDLENMSHQLATTFARLIKKMPSAFTHLLVAYDYLLGPSFEIIIAGNIESKDTRAMLETINSQFIPNKMIALSQEKEFNELKEVLNIIKNYKMLNNKATAYICKDNSCNNPLNEVEKVLKILTD